MGSQEQLLQQMLNHEIPLSEAIGIKVIEATDERVILKAALENNINHKSTAFGGSLYSVAVLAGWGLIFSRLQSLGLQAHIVIQESQIHYLQPVKQDIKAICRIESDEAFERLIKVYRKKGLARINLDVTIAGEKGAAVMFTGRYVIHD